MKGAAYSSYAPKEDQTAHTVCPKVRVHNQTLFSYFSINTYVVGTLKNRLIEIVLFEHPKTHA